jgi:predicted amidohydrolase YtcJ
MDEWTQRPRSRREFLRLSGTFTGLAAVVAACTSTPSPSSSATRSPQGKASSSGKAGVGLAFLGGPILTMSRDHPRVEALAIDDDRIVAVGSEAEVTPFIGTETRVVDLGGHALLPAFVDAHAHYFDHAVSDTGDPAAYLDHALANGTATFGEAGVPEAQLPIIQQLVDAGGLKLRTNLYLRVDDPCGDSQGDWWKRFAPTSDREAQVRIAGVKVWTDGGACNRPARSYPYADGSTGDLYFEPETLLPTLKEADRLGHQIVLHALGDRAIAVAKRTLSELLAGTDNALRHRIDHNAVLPPELRTGYAESGGTAVIFGPYPTCTYLGLDPRFRFPPPPDKVAFEWAWRGLIDANPGLHVAWHSDYPVFESAPGPTLYGFVTRKQVSGDGSICEPTADMTAGAISVEEALQAMTIGAAYALRREDQIGSLEPGKLADLVIVSDDPTAIEPDALKDLRVLATIIGGQAAYCDSPFGDLCAPPSPSPSSTPIPAAGGPNLAASGTASASNAVADNPPELAIDGDSDTIWLAGAGPPQWLAVDLGGFHLVGRVRLTVEQTPSGLTSHRVLGRLEDGSEILLAEVTGSTAPGQELDLQIAQPATVDRIRVETVESPSWVAWREVAIFEAQAPA